jgi:hypothetical protein
MDRVKVVDAVIWCFWIVVLALVFTLFLPAQQRQNPKLTPGAVDVTLVADLTKTSHPVNGIEHNICAAGFTTPPFRVATKSQKIKTAVCRAYGLTTGCPGPAWELDDIIPIEVGGQNVQANLWPQPIAEARVKDHQVEDTLGGPRGLVCAGRITLKDAQFCIMNDWVACAVTMKKLAAAPVQK